MCLLLVQRMMVQKVFPALTAEFHNHKMIPFVLPNVLMIAEESSIQEYATLVLPALEPVFAVQEPIQVCIRTFKYVCVYVRMRVRVCMHVYTYYVHTYTKYICIVPVVCVVHMGHTDLICTIVYNCKTCCVMCTYSCVTLCTLCMHLCVCMYLCVCVYIYTVHMHMLL